MFVEGFEAIAHFGKMRERLGQGVFQAPDSFEAVVKNDNGARAGMLCHILETLFAAQGLVEVPAEHIPHHDAVVALQELCLFGFLSSVVRGVVLVFV
jgi:hypothetical protein